MSRMMRNEKNQDMLRDLVNTIDVGAGLGLWDFKMKVHDHRPIVHFQIKVPCTNSGQLIYVRVDKEVPQYEWFTHTQAIQWLWDQIFWIVQHETKESLRVDGVLIEDPHVHDYILPNGDRKPNG